MCVCFEYALLFLRQIHVRSTGPPFITKCLATYTHKVPSRALLSALDSN